MATQATQPRRHSSIESVKHCLADEICAWIGENELTQAQASEKLGINRPRVSDLQRGRLEKFTVDALFNCLLSVGKRVDFVLSSPN